MNLQRLKHMAFVLIPLSLCFSLRWNSWMVILYAGLVLLEGKVLPRLKTVARIYWVYPFVVLYLIHLISLGWTANMEHGWMVLEKKAALLAMPILIAMDIGLEEERKKQAMWGLIMGCLIGFYYCLGNRLWIDPHLSNLGLFTYHGLSYPLDDFNAVYFSFYIFISLIFLDHLHKSGDHWLRTYPWVRWTLLLSFCLAILLLSSRLFIVFTALYFLINAINNNQKRASGNLVWWLGGLGIIVGVLFWGLGRDRFEDLLDSEFEVLEQEQFTYDTPFNGLTLRLLFLKFGWEILAKEQAFLHGIGAGDGQDAMDQTILDYNLYHGNPSLGDRGYLGYNYHNAYMELWVQIGLVGLICWLWLLIVSAQHILVSGFNHPFLILLFAIICYGMVESFLERQRGVVFLTFFFALFFRTLNEQSHYEYPT